MIGKEKLHFQTSLTPAVSFLALIWIVKILEVSLDINFGQYGTYPRTLTGSVGILLSPIIHADFGHLISNSFPLLFLGTGLFYFYPKVAWRSTAIIYVLSGFWVWLTARDAYHIGASGLVYGFMSFLLLSGFIRKDRKSLALSFVVLTLYGGSLFIGVIPSDSGVSWESHLLGGIAGIFSAFYFKNATIHSAGDNESPSEDTETISYQYTYRPSTGEKNEGKKYIQEVDLDNLRERDQAGE